MDPLKLIEAARDVISAKRVFGDPVERDGVTLVPAATVIGGGGGGGSEGAEGDADGGEEPGAPGGTGGGYGLIAWPTGAYEIRDGQARWIPALDTTRIAVLALIVLALVLRRRG